MQENGLVKTPPKLDTLYADYTLPDGHKTLLLHTCCAPCSGDIMLGLKEKGIEYTLFFYNPNIHPEAEYLKRKQENIRFAEALGVPFVDGDYDVDRWFEKAKGLENEPERGSRCTMCFDMRFDVTAAWAANNDFSLISSTLGVSRWKDMDQITQAGLRAASAYPQMDYWAINWRKKGGSQRMVEVSKQHQFYKQEYCGCVYSLRDTNKWRMANGRQRIKRGVLFYGQVSDEVDRS
jgi:epoxyqueuosine reductase